MRLARLAPALIATMCAAAAISCSVIEHTSFSVTALTWLKGVLSDMALLVALVAAWAASLAAASSCADESAVIQLGELSRTRKSSVPPNARGGRMSSMGSGPACVEDGYISSSLEASFAQDPLELTKDNETLCKALGAEGALWIDMNMNAAVATDGLKDPFSKFCRCLGYLTKQAVLFRFGSAFLRAELLQLLQ